MRETWRASLVIGLVLATSRVSPAAAQVPPVAVEPVPWLGISFDGDTAIQVIEVYPGTGAARAGIAAGDLVQAIDGIQVRDAESLLRMVRRHGAGDRIVVDLHRDGRDLRLLVVAGAMPTSSELLELRLVGSPLPNMEVADIHNGARVELLGRPAVLVVFAARCDPCGAAASSLAEAFASERGLPMRTVIVGNEDEVREYLRRVPVVGALSRWDRPARVGSVLAGLAVERDGAILVVDARGVVQFAASTADLDEVRGGVRAAAARCLPRGSRGR